MASRLVCISQSDTPNQKIPGPQIECPASEAAFPLSCLLVLVLTALFTVFSTSETLCFPESLPAVAEQNQADPTEASHQSGTGDTRDSEAASVVLDSLAAAGVKEPSFSGQQGSPIDWVWVFAAIFIVIGLLLLFLYFLRMVIYRPPGALAAGGQFEMLRQFHLGPRKSLCLVKVCDRLFLLGVTEQSITRLMEVDDPEEAAKIQAQLSASPGGQVRQFREVYQDLVGKFKK